MLECRISPVRRTKIVCTIGPASETEEVLKKMIIAGMNVARMNFSHGTHEEHARRIATVRKVAKELGKNVAIMLDTKGPEIRLGVFEKEPVLLHTGDEFTLTTKDILGNASCVSVSYEDLPKDVSVGSKILLSDGLIELEVLEVTDTDVRCRIVNGGELKSRKGVNLPGTRVNLPSLTDDDIKDILFGVEQGIDFIAASFIRKASDVLAIRDILEECGAHDIDIISKIESSEAVDNIEEILKVSDGIMVARGDLGVEIPAEDVPMIQKMLINRCNLLGKPVITATQMLESMIYNPRPTRAEASDVANAILDGTDAVMLSGESAAGKFPVEAVETMNRVAVRVESLFPHKEYSKKYEDVVAKTVTDTISRAVNDVARTLNAEAIITITASGHTAKMISRMRPTCPVIAVTPKPDVVRKMSIVWGVEAVLAENISDADEIYSQAVQAVLDSNLNLIKPGDLVVIAAGLPVGIQGTTNLLKVHTVGSILTKGIGVGTKAVSGTAKVCLNVEDAKQKINDGDIMVAVYTNKEFVPYMQKCSAVITEEGGITSHAAIVGLNLDMPVVVGVKNATQNISDGEFVTVDAQRGLIYSGIAKV